MKLGTDNELRERPKYDGVLDNVPIKSGIIVGVLNSAVLLLMLKVYILNQAIESMLGNYRCISPGLFKQCAAKKMQKTVEVTDWLLQPYLENYCDSNMTVTIDQSLAQCRRYRKMVEVSRYTNMLPIWKITVFSKIVIMMA